MGAEMVYSELNLCRHIAATGNRQRKVYIVIQNEEEFVAAEEAAVAECMPEGVSGGVIDVC